MLAGLSFLGQALPHLVEFGRTGREGGQQWHRPVGEHFDDDRAVGPQREIPGRAELFRVIDPDTASGPIVPRTRVAESR